MRLFDLELQQLDLVHLRFAFYNVFNQADRMMQIHPRLKKLSYSDSDLKAAKWEGQHAETFGT